MKKGRSDKTATFGSDAEHYVERLFLMMKNPNGDRRPDLVSINGRYNPKLSIEVKSGRQKKGVLNEEQLHYAITSWRDYVDIFGEEMDLGLLTLDESSNPEAVKVAYYYEVIDRTDELTSNDMDGPFSAVRIRWGDQYIVPHEYAFYSFAVARVMRTGEDLENVVEELRGKMREDALDVNGENYGTRRTTQSWQNLNGRDILAVFNKDLETATTQGKERIDLLSKVYSGLDSLERILIPAPNGTSVYVLSQSENYSLFNEQLRKTVEERTPVLENISREREEMTARMVSIEKKVLKIFGEEENYVSSMIPLNEDVRSKLGRMIKWLAEGEHPLDLIPF